MSSVVKKIKKTVKKVAKKNPITKIVKKITKGIKKFGSKVWGKVKKFGKSAFRKFAKFADKIGPIGMIALSFAMPYLMAGMSQAWAGLGNWLGAAAKAAPGAGMTFGNTMAQLGHSAWSGISKAGHFVKGTYQGITQTMTKTFEGFAGVKNAAGVRTGGSFSEGFGNLWKGTQDVVTGKAGLGTEIFRPVMVDGTKFMTGTGQFSGKLVQTGGVQAFNMNQLNMASQQVINQAMSGTTAMYNPDVQTYANTLSQEQGLNAFDAHKHMMENGVTLQGAPNSAYNEFTLNFNNSGDFNVLRPTSAPGAAPSYGWTGESAKIKWQGKGLDYVGIDKGALSYKGKNSYTYGSQDKTPSLLQRGGNAAMSYLSALGDDDQPYVPYAFGGDTSLDPFGTGYAGSDIYAATSGELLTKGQSGWFAGAKERLDYQSG